jgi:hypothetical protein
MTDGDEHPVDQVFEHTVYCSKSMKRKRGQRDRQVYWQCSLAVRRQTAKVAGFNTHYHCIFNDNFTNPLVLQDMSTSTQEVMDWNATIYSDKVQTEVGTDRCADDQQIGMTATLLSTQDEFMTRDNTEVSTDILVGDQKTGPACQVSGTSVPKTVKTREDVWSFWRTRDECEMGGDDTLRETAAKGFDKTRGGDKKLGDTPSIAVRSKLISKNKKGTLMSPVRKQNGARLATRGGKSGSMFLNSKTKISFFEGLVKKDKVATGCSFAPSAYISLGSNKISSGGLVDGVGRKSTETGKTGQVYTLYGVKTG